MGAQRSVGALPLMVAALISVGSVHVATPVRAAAPPSGGPQELAVADTSFYAVPDPLPEGARGDLLRWQVIDSSGSADRYRIMYLSESADDEPTAVTGVVTVSADLPPFGGWPTVLYGHGATGFADTCAPSMAMRPDAVNAEPAAEVESAASDFVGNDWAVVATDFQGLGGPGGHPLLDGVSSGRNLLDARRAASQVPGVYLSPTTAIAGFGEGGHAALWAAQLAPRRIPELDLVGTAVVAAVSDPGALAAATQPQTDALTTAVIAGVAAAHPETVVALGQVLTAEGIDRIQQWGTLCFGEEDDAAGPLVAADPRTVEPFATLLAEQVAGTSALSAPLLVVHASADAVVPVAQSSELVARLCAVGQTVEQRTTADATHASTRISLRSEAVPWLTGLRDGTTTPTSTCP